jgi:hypothetical protein
MLSKFWNSLEDVSRAVNWTQLALILFGGITLSLTYVQYKLSTRKDFLSGSSQKQKEEILNNRVSDASRDARNSIVELNQAKRDLAETQEQFAAAAKDADSAVRQLSAAQQTIDQLRARSGKVETLALRLKIVVSTDSVPNFSTASNTYMDSAPFAALVTADRKTLVFGSQQSGGFQVSEFVRLYTADLQILDQSSIAGRNISSLADYKTLAIAIGPYLKKIRLLEQTHAIMQVEAYLRINGTEIQVFNAPVEQALNRLTGIEELDVDIGSSMQGIADRYNKLMTN